MIVVAFLIMAFFVAAIVVVSLFKSGVWSWPWGKKERKAIVAEQGADGWQTALLDTTEKIPEEAIVLGFLKVDRGSDITSDDIEVSRGSLHFDD